MIDIYRIASKFKLKAGKKEEYKRRHDQIWPEMKALFKDAGIKNYSIWNIDNDLFGYFETEDIDRCRETIENSDVKKRWDKYMEDMIEVHPEGGSMELMFFNE